MKVKSKEDQDWRCLEVEWHEKLLTRDRIIRRMAALEDPSALRDREHKAAPLPARTPFDHFPDLKGWRVSGFDGQGSWRKTIK